MDKTFTVAGSQPAYGAMPGEVIQLDGDDAGVALNLAAGILVEGDKRPEPVRVPCPACSEQGMKRPPKFSAAAELGAHYAEKHPALVTPQWTDNNEDKEEVK